MTAPTYTLLIKTRSDVTVYTLEKGLEPDDAAEAFAELTDYRVGYVKRRLPRKPGRSLVFSTLASPLRVVLRVERPAFTTGTADELGTESVIA